MKVEYVLPDDAVLDVALVMTVDEASALRDYLGQHSSGENGIYEMYDKITDLLEGQTK